MATNRRLNPCSERDTCGPAVARVAEVLPSGALLEGSPGATAQAERDAWVVLLSVPGRGPLVSGRCCRRLGRRGRAAGRVRSGRPSRLLQALADAGAAEDGCENEATFDVGAAGERDSRRLAGGEWRRAAPAPAGDRTRPGRACLRCDAEWSRCRRTGSGTWPRGCDAGGELLSGPAATGDLPPPLLFVRGSASAMNAGKSVAVVGTRWPTDKGRLIAGWIGSAIARTGAAVVSGLAVGIDGAAHAAVVAEGGSDSGVLWRRTPRDCFRGRTSALRRRLSTPAAPWCRSSLPTRARVEERSRGEIDW